MINDILAISSRCSVVTTPYITKYESDRFNILVKNNSHIVVIDNKGAIYTNLKLAHTAIMGYTRY